jgi:ABC-2 type transport system permease protein
MTSLKLYLHYVSLSIRAQLQYRASFLLRTAAHFLLTFTEFLGLAALFKRFGHINGWTLPQMAFFYGIITVAFAIAEAVPRGFDIMPTLIKSGDFDRILLRPRSTVLQILGTELQLMRLGRLTQGALVLAYAAHALDVTWTFPKLALLLFAILGGSCLFAGLFVLYATLCFWTVESLEVINCATYGGVEAAQFPLTIYRPWFRDVFTFVVPLATINYFPAHALLGLRDPLGSSLLLQCLSPLAGVLFLAACLGFWRFGVRRYTSTGS